VDAELHKGSSGIYEVAVDGKVVAQRGSLGFPSEDEVVSQVQQALAR